LQVPLVSEKRDQGWLLNEAGLALLSTGRPKEAEELLIRKTKMQIEDEDWLNASVGYQNLADLRFQTGEIETGMESAKAALEMAEKVKFDRYIITSRAWLGWLYHLLGKDAQAATEFLEADELQINLDPDAFRLYSIGGIFYADFLLSQNRIDEALELTEQHFEICLSQNWGDTISRCHRCFGAIEKIKGKHKEAEVHLQDALRMARKIGQPILEIEAMLEFGRLWMEMGKKKEAIRDAREALKICGRTGFRLYEPGAEIVLGRAYLALKDFEKAASFAHSAYDKALSMKYRWAEGDAGHLLGEVYLAKADMGEAQKHLEKAISCRKEILDPNVEESEKMLEGLFN
jgi:tetratricopeptide (TPR) repeat protein